MPEIDWRPSELAFLKAHPNADYLVTDREGRIVAAFYVSPYGSTVRDVRSFLAAVEDLRGEDIL